MKIYALKDRFLNYYLAPFIGESQQQVIAAVAMLITTGGEQHAISQAPHHFEIWELADFDEQTGELNTSTRNLVIDCSSIVRGSLRNTGEQGSRETGGPAAQGKGQPLYSRDLRATEKRAVATALEPEDRTPPNSYPKDRGADQRTEDRSLIDPARGSI